MKEVPNLDDVVLSLSHPFISPKLLLRLQQMELDFEQNPDSSVRNACFFLTEL